MINLLDYYYVSEALDFLYNKKNVELDNIKIYDYMLELLNILGSKDLDYGLHVFLNSWNNLDKNEKKVITDHFGLLDGETHNLSELGKMYNMSKEQFKYMEINILKKMRIYANNKKSRSLLIFYFIYIFTNIIIKIFFGFIKLFLSSNCPT